MFLYSYILLWVLITVLCATTVVILKRITPSKPKLDMDDSGLEKGSKFPILNFNSLSQEKINLINPHNLGTVAIFISVNCNACNNVLASLMGFIKKHNNLSIIVFIRGENKQELIQKAGTLINQVSFIELTDSYLEEFRIPAFPFSYFISSKGNVIEKGGVPAGDYHLELLTKLALTNKQKAA